jgi:hypothetical protein
MIHLNHNQKLLLFVIILISPLILINEFTYFQENNKLKTNSLKTHGKIFEIGVPTGRGGRSSKYSFFINGKKYTSEIRSNSYCQNISKIAIDSISHVSKIN